MNKFKIKEFEFNELDNKIALPTFQRSFVWQEKKKKALIMTIKKGLPIGTILLSEEFNGKYKVVDGLQRIATLRDFRKEPLKYLEDSEVSSDEIIEMLTSTKESNDIYQNYADRSKKNLVESTKKIIVDEIKNNICGDINDKSWAITEKLIKQTSILNENAKIAVQKNIYKLLKKIESILDINKYKIPAIIFCGPDEELVEVFTLLNSSGTKLSKYDVFAAKWNDVTLKGVDEEILDVVIKKYDSSVEKSGIEISGFSPVQFKKDCEINVFEYAYSIGKLIGEKTKVIFKSKDDSIVDSLGFTVLAGIFNIPNKNMYLLADKLQIQGFDYSELKNSILSTSKEIEKLLIKYISNHNQDTDYAVHTEMQLASYVIALFRLSYDITNNKVQKIDTFKNEIKKFKRFLHIHYLYDIYRRQWSGSGDTLLDQLVIDDAESTYNNTIVTSRYMSEIDNIDFQHAMSSWINSENEKDKSMISKETRLFHNCIINSSLTKLETHKLDFDHIVPKKRFEAIKGNTNIRLPISSPCNIALIPRYDNRGKKEYTYYEYEDLNPGISKKYTEKELKRFNYPSTEELRFMHNKTTFDSKDYITFLNNRKQEIIDRFIDAVYHQKS